MNSDQEPILIRGGVFKDERGQIEFVNDFNLKEIKRFYITTNNATSLFRGWQGHKIEKRWFYCVQGAFEVSLIKIDDWEQPSEKLKIEKYNLSEDNSLILFIPSGYVNGFQALTSNSKMLIYSDYRMNEIQNDEVRFPATKWMDS